MVWRYDRIRKPSTTSRAMVIGVTRENTAAAPSPPITRTRRISSVAYAHDDKLSDANTANAVGLPSVSCSKRSLCNGGPSRRRLIRYPVDSASVKLCPVDVGTIGGGEGGPTGSRSVSGRPVTSTVRVNSAVRDGHQDHH